MAILARAGFRVAAPDTRGANRSGKPSDAADYTDQRFVHDVVEILDQLGWQRAYLAGHDVGGGTAWQLAFEAPERFRAAMIFNVPHPLAWENARPEDDSESVSWFRGFFRLPFLPEMVSRAGDYWLLSYYLRNTSRPGTFTPEELDVYKSSWAFEQSIGSTINSYRAPATELQGLTSHGPQPSRSG